MSILSKIKTNIKNLLTILILTCSILTSLSALSLIPSSSTVQQLLTAVTQPVSISAVGNCATNYTYVGKDICRKVFTVAGLSDATYPCTTVSAGGMAGAYLYSVSNRIGTCYHDIAPLSFTCPAGEFLTTANSDSCQQCTPGFYCAGGLGFTTPTQCQVGYYCGGGDANQIICPAGFFCNSVQQTYYDRCPEFKTSPVGSSTCPTAVLCGFGQYQTGSTCNDCIAGNYCRSGVTTQIPCVAGEYCIAKAFYGAQCPASTYCPNPGTSTPTQCKANTYCPGSSTTETPCPSGTTSSAGTGSLEGCIPNSCPTGQILTAGTCALTPKSYGDVKYVNNGFPTVGNTKATPGGTVTQRVYYDNTTDKALINVSVKTSLPTGFTYIPGSLQHCKEPSEVETTCDTQSASVKDQMFNNLTGQNGAIGISPAAGFYDAADTGANGTAPTAQAGILDAGKKRYLNLNGCEYEQQTFEGNRKRISVLLVPALNPRFGSNNTDIFNSSVKGGCGVGTLADPYNSGFTPSNRSKEIVYKKFYTLAQLVRFNPFTNGFNTFWNEDDVSGKAFSGASNGLPIFDGSGNPYTNLDANGGPYIEPTDLNHSGWNQVTLLANRFMNMSQCAYKDSGSRIMVSMIGGTPLSPQFASQFTASNTPIQAYNCGPGGTVAGSAYTLETGLSAYKAIDMLDTSRAKGYFEYKMIVPTSGLATSYTVPVTMSAKTYGTGTDGAGGVAVTSVVTNGIINVEEVKLNLKVNLAGAFNPASVTATTTTTTSPKGLMTNTLNTLGLLSNAQPYNTAPYSYSGLETLPATSTISDQVCDWVLVEVRDTTTVNGGVGNLLSSKAALILKDGTIIDATKATTTNLAAIASGSNTAITGVDIAGLTASGNYKVSVRHRNHIGISTDVPVTLTLGGFTNIDFTTGQNIKGNTTTTINAEPVGVVGGGSYNPSATPGSPGSYIYGLRKGDATGNGSILAEDRNALLGASEFSRVYDNRDLNLDGDIEATDRTISINALEASVNL